MSGLLLKGVVNSYMFLFVRKNIIKIIKVKEYIYGYRGNIESIDISI